MFFRRKPTSQSDAELISRFRDSDDLAFLSELFGRYTSMIYGVCLKYLRDRDDAKDAVMQIFERLPKSTKEHEIANFKSWIYVTARNHCLMQIRSKKAKHMERLDLDRMENELVVHPDDESDLGPDLGKLEKCLETLAVEQKQCVRMFFLEEQCYRDIAAATGYDASKVKSYIQNGKRNLKICMEGK